MKFRKLYWVTEQLGTNGHSEVTGVYTSIPDLIDHGLRWIGEQAQREGLRLSLVQLDSPNRPLGCWRSPDFAGLREDLRPYQTNDEISAEHCEALIEALPSFVAVAS
ncbi:MAG: hypothetical protein KIS66_12965 [Fimbriimonadaceae bacterium]|nr:hypothetical protein [Fimbriimonadaceae bacterium]